MKLRYFGALVGCLALAACDSDKEEAITTTEDSAQVDTGTAADFIATAGDRVFFELNKHDLSPEAKATLERQAAWWKAHPDKEFVVEGHCDERGTREYNLALGERRANQAIGFLVDYGVSENHIRGYSCGKDRPFEILGANKEEFWRQNRTAVTVVQ
ncbi:MAG: OmpA family protein [Holosporales bacterium]|jgi:peptidoglycan-associated lipoprotein|nr:OmpA family protein [Holosporales bacterium]